ncbi:MAG: cell envelope integrity EipB family protein [Pseudomonadota bacterium]
MALGVTTAFAGPLQPHRAVYDVELADATERSGILGMRGRMVYEFRGAECEGYTTNFRFVTQIGARGVPTRVTDQQTTTFEAGDGSLFRFVTKTFVDSTPDQEVEGTATMAEEGVVVDLKEPTDLQLDLDAALFPTSHMLNLLERAAEGERFYEQKIFDGSDDGDRVMTTTVILGAEKTAEPTDLEALVAPVLTENPYRKVSIAYFDETDTTGEGLPEYRIAFKMLGNGITRDLELDYGDFALRGTLKELELFDASAC